MLTALRGAVSGSMPKIAVAVTRVIFIRCCHWNDILKVLVYAFGLKSGAFANRSAVQSYLSRKPLGGSPVLLKQQGFDARTSSRCRAAWVQQKRLWLAL
jgi:hypothetical protein